MKKTLFSKLATVMLLLVFVACGDDDSKNTGNSNPNDKIIGTWVYNGYYDEQGTFVADDTNECWAYNITFKSDGSGNEFEKDCQNGNTTNNHSWKNMGNNAYKITFSNENIDLINVTFTSDTQADVSWDGGTTKERFTKQ